MGSHDAHVLREPDRPYDGRSAPIERIESLEQLEQAINRRHGLSSIRLGACLLELGLIDQAQLDRALQIQRGQSHRHLGEILLELGFASPEYIQQILCQQLGIPSVDLTRFEVDLSVLRFVPHDMALKLRVFPICCLQGKLVVAVSNPFEPERLAPVRFFAQMPVFPVVANSADIQHAIYVHYHGAFRYAGMAASVPIEHASRFDGNGMRASPLKASIDELVTRIITDAHALRVSDIHIDASPGAERTAVRFRREGQLTNHAEIPRYLRSAVIARIKAIAGISVAATAGVREGRISRLEHGPAGLQVRVLAVSTHDGSEHIAMKLVLMREPLALDALGMGQAISDVVRALIARPRGLMLVGAPAGEGRTTTAHALLDLVDPARAKVWTAENPVERMREGASQIEVNAAIGWDYPAVVRAVLRADPDALLIGDLPDRETSALAVQSALGTCRVIATVNAGNAADAVALLLERGVEAYGFADALLSVLSQRLVRRLCEACRRSRPLTAAEINTLAREYCAGTLLDSTHVVAEWETRFDGDLRLHGAAGCELCNGTGYRGRVGIFELLSGGSEIRGLMRQRRPADELARAAMRNGMRTLKQDGIDKVLAGLCDVPELRAVLS